MLWRRSLHPIGWMFSMRRLIFGRSCIARFALLRRNVSFWSKPKCGQTWWRRQGVEKFRSYWRTRAYRRDRNEGFDASGFSSRPSFGGSILSASRRAKMGSDGKSWALPRHEFTPLATLNTTCRISRAHQPSCNDLSKQKLIQRVRFFSAAARTEARKKF